MCFSVFVWLCLLCCVFSVFILHGPAAKFVFVYKLICTVACSTHLPITAPHSSPLPPPHLGNYERVSLWDWAWRQGIQVCKDCLSKWDLWWTKCVKRFVENVGRETRSMVMRIHLKDVLFPRQKRLQWVSLLVKQEARKIPQLKRSSNWNRPSFIVQAASFSRCCDVKHEVRSWCCSRFKIIMNISRIFNKSQTFKMLSAIVAKALAKALSNADRWETGGAVCGVVRLRCWCDSKGLSPCRAANVWNEEARLLLLPEPGAESHKRLRSDISVQL